MITEIISSTEKTINIVKHIHRTIIQAIQIRYREALT
jgi:hypothetical protein